mmetsp:Transcript_4312/g.12431  ORF Transcript_4312/g.12431 Transcript_4312/m.12431 type:complete len:114 (+) Transcript_4312:219-560(+)
MLQLAPLTPSGSKEDTCPDIAPALMLWQLSELFRPQHCRTGGPADCIDSSGGGHASQHAVSVPPLQRTQRQRHLQLTWPSFVPDLGTNPSAIIPMAAVSRYRPFVPVQGGLQS